MSISTLETRLRESVPPGRIATDGAALRSNAGDYHWFSNLLEDALRDCRPEIVVWPENVGELADVLAAAYEERTPVTIRAGATGNYGQCVPLEGGLVVNVTRMRRVLELGDGAARVEPGVTFALLDRAAAATGQEVAIYPSTYHTGTLAGFVAGGSMGVGSITHGALVDDNCLGATVLPVTASPEPIAAVDGDLLRYVHAYGTTGVLADVTMTLAPRRAWEQAVFGFGELAACHAFCLDVIADEGLERRMITTLEPSIVEHYVERTRLPFRPDLTAAMILFGEGGLSRLERLAERHGGELEFALPADSRTRLSDFSWNHSTLWAKKADRGLTYLQARFAIDDLDRQIAAARSAEPGFALHGEYVKWGGEPTLVGLPIVPYRGRQRLSELIEALEAAGVGIANPHSYVLEEGSLVANLDELVETKRRNDPAGLLNPGKLAAAGAKLFFARAASMGLAET
jgi:FAD/FMN-containing dehydrogenase